MTSSLGKQIVGQYKELSINNYETCPAMPPTAWNGRERPCHCKGIAPNQGHYKEGTFLCQ